jgi:D-aminoacyl-tRNA deacylase
MRAFVQRVLKADVSVESEVTGRIDQGLLVLLGVRYDDTEARAEYLARKVLQLRIFEDEGGKMNRSVTDVKGELLIVSQFTLYGDTSRGNRPSYSQAAKAEVAEPLYRTFVKHCKKAGLHVATGVFGATMLVSLVNDGPVSLLCDTEI